MYEFWCDYGKPKYDEDAKHYYMDTFTFMVHVKTEGIYLDIAEDVEIKFDNSNFNEKIHYLQVRITK